MSQPEEHKWIYPQEAMQLHKMKLKKKALQARLNRSLPSLSSSQPAAASSQQLQSSARMRNPFIKNPTDKKPKLSSDLDESSDNTVYKLLQLSNGTSQAQSASYQTFTEALQNNVGLKDTVTVEGKSWIPIDWSLKSKARFISAKPFEWSSILKTSEEASGITGFTRCLNTMRETSLDTSPNARFHQCCLYWQQPNLPWLNLFPRSRKSALNVSNSNNNNNSSNNSSSSNNNMPNLMTLPAVRESFLQAWRSSLKSLFQLLRARQCPYFYVCANDFTALFRSAGICGHAELHVLLSPTTRGFRQVLKQEEIEFTTPLKAKRKSTEESPSSSSPSSEVLDSSKDDVEDEEENEEKWLQSLGMDAEDIKRINYVEERRQRRQESQGDNSEQSLVYIEGVEAHAFYIFLTNCKSAVGQTGPLAGVPPTLLAPVAFQGASLKALKVRQHKTTVESNQYYSVELQGPILPQAVHNLCSIHPKDSSFTAVFANVAATAPFSKVRPPETDGSESIAEPPSGLAFGKENLSDCGLSDAILEHFCSPHFSHQHYIDSLKYTAETQLYTWT